MLGYALVVAAPRQGNATSRRMAPVFTSFAVCLPSKGGNVDWEAGGETHARVGSSRLFTSIILRATRTRNQLETVGRGSALQRITRLQTLCALDPSFLDLPGKESVKLDVPEYGETA